MPVADPLERLEDALLQLVRHAGPVVRHLEPHRAAIQDRVQLGRPPGGGVPQRVGEQVGQDPLEQAGVGQHQREAVRHRHLQPQRVVEPARRDRRHLVDRDGAQERLQRPGVQAAHVEQVADERVEPVRVLLDGGQQVGLVGFGPLHVGLPQAADRGLDRGQRGAQVVADRGEQRGPHPVAFGQRLGLGRLGTQPLPVQRGRRLGGVPGQQGRRGRGVLPGDHQGQVGPDVDARRRRQHPVDAARGGPHPPAGHPLLQLGLPAVGPGEVLEHGGGGVGAAQHGLRQLEQRGRLLAGPGGLHRAPGGQVDDAADGDRDGHEQQQRQQLARLGDRERVDRRGEVPVEQQAGRHGGEHGGPEAADHRDGHHRNQVDQDEVGQVQVRPRGREDHGEQRQQDRGQQHARQPPPDPDRGTGSGTGRGRRAGRRSEAPRRMPVVLPMLTSVSLRQYQRNTRPNPAPASAVAARPPAACTAAGPAGRSCA